MRTDAHKFLRLKTKTSFRHFIKHITYNPYDKDISYHHMGKMTKKLARENKKGTKNRVEKSIRKNNYY